MNNKALRDCLKDASRSYRKSPKWMLICDGVNQPFYMKDYVKILEGIAYGKKTQKQVDLARKAKHYLDTGEY